MADVIQDLGDVGGTFQGVVQALMITVVKPLNFLPFAADTSSINVQNGIKVIIVNEVRNVNVNSGIILDINSVSAFHIRLIKDNLLVLW